MKIQLVDYNEELCVQWRKAFEGCDDVTVHCENYFSVPTDCYVSPANSYGFLDGGIDNKIRKHYEKHHIDIQQGVWDAIVKQFDGELLVGQCFYLPVWHIGSMKKYVPDLIVAPTMRVPMKLPHDSVNVYLAMKAILLKLKSLEMMNSSRVKSVSISGLGTGIGQLPYNLCAKQMRKAYDDFWMGENYFPKSWGEAQDNHQLLYSDEVSGDLQYDNKDLDL
jgi:O-acetyl-ADP-ribose deacetylase (regulator of RNase III)